MKSSFMQLFSTLGSRGPGGGSATGWRIYRWLSVLQVAVAVASLVVAVPLPAAGFSA